MPLIPPQPNEVEVTLLGTGGGYGESILIKLAENSWVVIDSCIDPVTRKSLPDLYLQEVGVNYDDVKLVVCTHWHQDHINGLSALLLKCPNAKFAFASAIDPTKFLHLCGLEEKKGQKGGVRSTKEFVDCLNTIASRGGYCIKVQADLLIFREEYNGINFELFALSPSPAVVANFDGEISSLISELAERNTAIENRTPNEKSIALLLKFGEHRVILGSDLEIGKTAHEGWQYVISSCLSIDQIPAELFKVPHHGSETGYCQSIFDNIVAQKGILKIAPYLSQGLPSFEMLEKYKTHSSELYTTTEVRIASSKPKNRDRALTKIIQQSVRRIREIKFEHGIVRCRIDYQVGRCSWNVELHNSAVRVIP